MVWPQAPFTTLVLHIISSSSCCGGSVMCLFRKVDSLFSSAAHCLSFLLRLFTSPLFSSPSRPSGSPSVRKQTIAAACSADFFDFSLNKNIRDINDSLLHDALNICLFAQKTHQSVDLYLISATITVDWNALSWLRCFYEVKSHILLFFFITQTCPHSNLQIMVHRCKKGSWAFLFQ